MPWFKVDDGLAFHRKVVAAGNAAMGLWLRAGSWSAHELTDGFVPAHMVGIIGTPAQAAKLVKAGLWQAVDGGYQFHEWHENGQPTAVSVRAERADNAQRQAEFRKKRREKKNLPSATVLQYGRTADGISSESNETFSEDAQVNGGCHGVTRLLVTPSVTPVVTGAPSRPVPTRPLEEHSLAPLADSAPEPAPAPSPPDRFAEFYAAYPRREDRKAAERAWKAVIRAKVDPDRVIAAARAYADATAQTERRFIKLPATWLNAGAYDNEPAPLLPRAAGGWDGPYRNPTDDSVWNEPLLPLNPQGVR